MLNSIKKTLSNLLIVLLVFSTITFSVNADEKKFIVGDYFSIGQYNNAPILWKCIGDDGNGKLLISDKILCFKWFGYSSIWMDATIRTWLNSTALSAAAIEWPVFYYESGVMQPTGSADTYNGEAGFLCDNNFTVSQRNLMKSVTQWTMLP